MYKLLIVDDEPMTREYMKAQINGLHREWICAGEAEDGQEALDLIDRGDSFDLVITDIKMPVMNGLELARELSGRRGRPRVVILSGYDEFALAKEAMHYGVDEYMLKPLVKEEIVDVLGRMAAELAAERAEQASYRTLSEQSREQIARNFLHAAATDNHMEFKVLYPLLHRLKINLIEAEGAVMLVDLDEGQLLDRGISPSDHALFRYIVHQTASELADAGSGIVLFVDPEQRTALLVPGDDESDVRTRCSAMFASLSRAIADMTGLGLWGAAGSSEMEVQQLGASYRTASDLMLQRLFEDRQKLFMWNRGADLPDPGARADELRASIAAIGASLAEGREPELQAALRALAKPISPASRTSALRLGAYLLHSLSSGVPKERRQAALLSAVRMLRQDAPEENGTAEALAAVYFRAIRQLRAKSPSAASPNTGSGGEHETVTKMKAYIHAHYAEPLSLALIADKLGVSPGYLSSLFHQNTQESYIKYLTRIRMEHAARMLRSKPPDKVYDVAEKVGYLSVKHFSYVFKQHFGTPPGEYQEKALR